jgi:hypothetical protein
MQDTLMRTSSPQYNIVQRLSCQSRLLNRTGHAARPNELGYCFQEFVYEKPWLLPVTGSPRQVAGIILRSDRDFDFTLASAMSLKGATHCEIMPSSRVRVLCAPHLGTCLHSIVHAEHAKWRFPNR